MMHNNFLTIIKKDRQWKNFILPYYGSYSIAEIAPSILRLFGIPTKRAHFSNPIFNRIRQDNQKIIFFLIDGLGYHQFERFQKEIKLFHILNERGDVYPLTSVFPSTTPAALTTIHTGLTPQEHGLPEWTVYFEEFDKIIMTFPFRPLKTSSQESLLTMGGTPEMLYDGPTVYEILKKAGVKSYVFISQDYALSAYSQATHKGAEVITYRNLSDICIKLVKILNQDPGRAYFFVYWSHIDNIEHAYGPYSTQHISSLLQFSDILWNQFFKAITPNTVRDALFLLSSDHGQTNIKGEDIIYLNDYLPLEASYLWGKSKDTIQPTGAPHDVFLHIYTPHLSRILRFLLTKLEKKAEVLPISEALRMGLFGINTPSERFLRRIGNILIIPNQGYHIWYKHLENYQFNQLGTHGGLSEEEMLVPFVIAPLEALIKSK